LTQALVNRLADLLAASSVASDRLFRSRRRPQPGPEHQNTASIRRDAATSTSRRKSPQRSAKVPSGRPG
jgi:hypothetical protein